MGLDAFFPGSGDLRRPQTVLVVDDEPDILESLKDILEASYPNLRVVPTLGAREALEVLQREPVALILSDFKMPGMNGLDFLKQARQQWPATPSVLITAFPDTDVAIKAINEAGVDYFVTKPFSPGTVMTVVRDLLSEHRAREMRAGSFERARELLESMPVRRGGALPANASARPSAEGGAARG